jgi:hypothetical protein
MSEQKELLPIKLEPILVQIQERAPRMAAGRDKAVAALQAHLDTNPQTTEEKKQWSEKANSLLVAVRNTYNQIYALRKEVTDQTDKIKDFLMTFEKDIDQNAKDNLVVSMRSRIGAYNQEILDANKKAAEEAARQKEKENHKVEISVRIKKNLADMVIARLQKVHKGSNEYFSNVTLEEFDAKATQFKKFKPILKQEDYISCFATEYNRNLLTEEEYKALMEKLSTEEPYEKWNEEVMKVVVPVLNEYIASIPDIKQKLIALSNAKSEEDRARIESEQKQKAEEEENRRQEEIRKKQEEQEAEIRRKAELDKMGNEFVEQIVTQQLEEAGPVKLILRFKEDKPVKALAEIMYHCFMHPKFPGIQKMNKQKQPMFDEHNFPVYVDGADWWISFFVKNCSVDIEGVEIKEVSKVIVRK